MENNEFKEKLIELDLALTNILEPKNNNFQNTSLFPLLDFTTVAHYDETSLRTVSKYYHRLGNSYSTKLKSYFEDKGYTFPEYKKTKITKDGLESTFEVKDINSNKKLNALDEASYQEYIGTKQDNVDYVTSLESWYEFVEKNFESSVKSSYNYFEKIPIGINEGEFLEVGIYLLCRRPLERCGETKFENFNKALSSFIRINCIQFIVNEENDKQKFNTSALKKQTIKASLASIIARGLSHTDGSHSMIYFEKNYEELIGREQFRLAQQQFKQYNKHLREVMELTADITGGIGSQTSYGYNFKTVLDSISGLVIVNDNEIKSITGYFPKKNANYNEIFNNYCVEDTRTFICDAIVDNQFRCCVNFKSDCNKTILLPGGVNSITAFIQILKNIFRNIYKHNFTNKNKSDEKIELVTLNINVADIESNDSHSSLSKDYYKLTITESVKFNGGAKDQDKLNNLKDIVKCNILNDHGEVDGTAWGIKEIKIQAAYMIGLAIESPETWEEKFPDNSWYSVDVNEQYHLQHIFYLKKEKKATIITESYDENVNMLTKKFDYLFHKIIPEQKLDKWYSSIDKDSEYVVFCKNYSPKKYKKSLSENNLTAFKARNFKVLIIEKIDKKKIEKLDELWYCNYYNTPMKTEDKLTEDDKYFFDDNHSKGIIKVKSGLDWIDKTVLKSVWENLDYYEAFPEDNKLNKLIFINTNIAILDERIQKYVIDSKDQNIRYLKDTNGKKIDINLREILEKKGVFIPTDQNLYKLFYDKDNAKEHEINDNGSGLKNLQLLENLLQEYFSLEGRNCQYVILHFSGLESIANSISDENIINLRHKIVNQKKEKIDESNEPKKIDVVYTYLVKCKLELPKTNKYLILTSGKGTPTTLPNHSFFINLANVERLIKTKNITKLEMIKNLECIRQINNKK